MMLPIHASGPLEYHRRIKEYLKANEAAAWRFHAAEHDPGQAAEALRLELLKTTYRLDPAEHAALHESGQRAQGRLGLADPFTLYQAHENQPMNVMLRGWPGDWHIVFHGPVLATLTPEELESVLAHEFTHTRLLTEEEGEYRIAERVLGALAADPRAEINHLESARRYQLYTEIYADRGALQATGNLELTVAALVKLHTGLAQVSAASYLRQAEEIFAHEAARTAELTHPEAFIRARALSLWADRGAQADETIAAMIEGPLELNRLDLLDQERVAALTRRLIARLLAPAWLRTEPTLAHARLFFEDFAPSGSGAQDDSLAADWQAAGDKLRDYVCYVLLDFATIDRALEDYPMAAALRLADELGCADRFGEIAVQELKMTKKLLQQLRREAAAMLAEADRNPPAAAASAEDEA